MDNLQHDQLGNMGLEIDNDVRIQFNEAAKWTKFISIVMFVACGLLLIVGLLGGAALVSALKTLGSTYEVFGEFNGAILIIIIVIVVGVLALVYYFLFNFSKKIKMALLSESTADLNAGLKSLKIFFIVTTVFAILSLVSNIYNLFF